MSPTERQRQAIAARDKGLKIAEIASEMGISQRGVLRLLQRAKQAQTQPQPNPVHISGLTPSDHQPEPECIWDELIQKQATTEQYVAQKYAQAIRVCEHKPIAIATLSDLHLGSNYCDYRGIKHDAEMIAQTDGMYALAAGDYWDNWIGKLEFIQRQQKCDFESELRLVEWWFETLGNSLLCVIAGNHDNRTKNIAGIDYVKKLLGKRKLLYDSDEVSFKLQFADTEWKIKARHKWRGHSMYNQTHGEERDARFGDVDWDIAIGGHTHEGTVFREFVHNGRLRLAVQIGTYCYEDRYARGLGLPQNRPGVGGIVFHPDGKIETKRDLETTAKYLAWARSE